MATFHYTRTVTYTLSVEADSQEAADAIADATDLNDPNVGCDSGAWEEDGYSEYD